MVLVPATVEAVYGHLAAMERHPQWVDGLEGVQRTGPSRHLWRVAGPSGPLRWRVETTVDRPYDRFGFCMEGPGIAGFTLARIVAQGPATGVLVERFVEIEPGHGLRRWWGDPAGRLRADLWRFRASLAPQGRSDLTRSLSGPSRTSLFSS